MALCIHSPKGRCCTSLLTIVGKKRRRDWRIDGELSEAQPKAALSRKTALKPQQMDG